MVRIGMSFQAWILVVAVGSLACAGDDSVVSDATDQAVYVRVNQVGYLDNDTKIAIAFSHEHVEGQFAVVDHATGNTVLPTGGHAVELPRAGGPSHTITVSISAR